jgi:hypothetical protein
VIGEMGIYITLKRPEATTFRDVALNRLHYATEIALFFVNGHVFQPQEISVWHNRPSEALGGERLFPEVKVSEFFRDMAKLKQQFSDSKFFPFELLVSTVVRIEGYWDLNGNRLSGFFSINNSPSWREVYRDIEIDAYGKGETKDLVDTIWKRDDAKGIFKEIIRTLDNAAKGQSVIPHEVFCTVGIPEKGEVKNIRGIHCSSRRYLYDFFYSALSEQGEADIREKLGPLRQSFFIGTLADNKIVAQRFEEALRETVIEEEIGQSVTYFAKESKSFEQLYQKVYENVFKPAFKRLPKANDVRQNIAAGLEHTPPLG